MVARAWLTAKERDTRQAERNKRWAAENRDYRREYMKQWRRENPLRAVLQGLTTGARIRGRKHGIGSDWYALDIDRLHNLLVNDMRCPCCGVEMTAKVEQGHCQTAISLDRVDNTLGYIRGNVQVICRRCNTRKRDMLLEDLERLAAYVRRFTL